VAESNQPIDVAFCVTESFDPETLAADTALLSPDERARADRFSFAEDRREFVSARALLRRTLSRHRPLTPDAWRFEPGEHGKPMLARDCQTTSPLHFNVSHTRGLVACVVSVVGDVGIDVERTDRAADVDALAARFFDATELARLRDLPASARPTRFFELWTLKEAYLKARGVGMTMPLRHPVFEFVDPDALRFSTGEQSPPAGWRFALYGVGRDRYRAAVAWTAHPPACIHVRICGESGQADPVMLLRTSGDR
jgi:4'-phosphopantetheinyl transferase